MSDVVVRCETADVFSYRAATRKGKAFLERAVSASDVIDGVVYLHSTIKMSLLEWRMRHNRVSYVVDCSGRQTGHASGNAAGRPSRPGVESLSSILDEHVSHIGKERVQNNIRASGYTVRHLATPSSPYGRSHRFLLEENRETVSGLQVVEVPGEGFVIASVYTRPAYRRRGYARVLLEAARKRLGLVRHSKDLSPAGTAWAAAVG